MARTGTESGSAGTGNSQETLNFQADGQHRIELPSSDFIADATMTREGDDLILQTPDGQTAIIEGYFSADPAPLLQSADGATLTPNLVDAFSRSPMEFAAKESASDESPIGAVEEVKGSATVTRADGTVETVTIGTPIYQGDVVETDAAGAVNIVFIDETSMAVSENARLAIDEYTFDPSTESGTTNFSVLRGLFVFTSGLIGRDDPDDVSIDTPVGSIGIRGTVIAGEINPSGESMITVLEGAIVVKNGATESVLSEQFETVSLRGFDEPIQDMGVVPASQINTRYNSIGDVNPGLFSMINDTVREQSAPEQPVQQNQQPAEQSSSEQSHSEVAPPAASEPITTVETAPVVPPVAEPPSPMNPDMATLDGNSTGLPPQNVIAGEPPVLNSGSQSPVAPVITSPAMPAATEPVAPLPATSTIPAATSPSEIVPPPPPSVINNPGAGTGSGTVTPAPSTPNFAFAASVVTDIAGENHTVGNITGSSGATITSYTITSANSAYFDVTVSGNNATINLSQAGADHLASSFDVLQLGAITIEAVASDGTVITRTVTANVIDSHAAADFVNLDDSLTPQRAAVISDSIDNSIGYTITALGDVNNDGFDDFAFSNNTTEAGQNHSYEFMGRAGVFITGNLPSLSPVILPNHTPTTGQNYHSSVIAGIGDFDGDGVEDYIVGQPGNQGSVAGSGAATIVSGANNANHIVSGTGIATGSQFGQSVDGVGDFNNDGYADVIIGAPGIDRSFFMLGRDATWSENIFSNAASLQYTGAVGFGSSVSGIGDFNGDGYSDFAVGAPGANTNAGMVALYMGNDNGTTSPGRIINGTTGQGLGQEISGLGDINGDGYSDMLIGGGGNTGRIQFGAVTGTGASVELDVPAGSYTFTGADGVGDFNGDGFDDFVVTFGDANGTNAYVVYGRENFSSAIDIGYLKNSDNAFELTYSYANENDDIEVGAIGDINGDGYDDFALGLPDANRLSAGNGGLAIVYGRDTGNIDVQGTAASATADGQSLIGTAGSDLLDDEGFAELSLRGGAGEDVFQISNTNFRSIDGGNNTGLTHDTIRAAADLDFSDVNFESIAGIEKIEYGGNGQNITLTMENLFNLMKSSDSGIFRISADSMSGVTLALTDGDGADDYAGTSNTLAQMNEFFDDNVEASVTTSAATEAGINYDVFSIGGYRLMIDQNITVDAQ